jgi:hypothetical protein
VAYSKRFDEVICGGEFEIGGADAWPWGEFASSLAISIAPLGSGYAGSSTHPCYVRLCDSA